MRAGRGVLLAITLIAITLPSSAGAAATGQGIIWIQRYKTGLYSENIGRRVAVSPDGARVYVTGESREPGHPYPDIVTIAYDAAAGSQIWLRRYDGPGHSIDFPVDIAISPDGARLYVAGWVGNGEGDSDYGTIAYDAVTGKELWAQVFDGLVGSFDNLVSLAVNPARPMVYVTGSSVTDGMGNSDYLTFAYDALTGAVDWHRYYHGPANTDDEAQGLAVSHDGSTLFVTGASMNPDWECATLAYDGASGRTRWVRRIHSPYPETNGCVAVDVSPDGSRVFLSRGDRG